MDDGQQDLEHGNTLLMASAGGDRGAFHRLYLREAPRLLALARRFTGDSGAAEDAVQETFVQAWSNADRFQSERGSARAWLHGILRLRLLSQYRGARHQRHDDLPGDDWPDPGPSPEQCSLDDRRDRALRLCLRDLRGERRRPILMAFYLGYTYEQIAEHLAVPLGTIKSRIRSGLKGLEECLRL